MDISIIKYVTLDHYSFDSYRILSINSEENKYCLLINNLHNFLH